MKKTPDSDALPFARCGLVVVAAGSGSRFGGHKQLAPVGGRPLLLWALAAFASIPFAGRVVVVPATFLEDGTWDRLLEEEPALAAFRPVAGGAERALSVLVGLEALGEECELAAVHDGARPFPPIDATRQAIHLLNDRPEIACAVVSAPVTDTIKHVAADGRTIQETIYRGDLRRAETPQVSRRSLLLAVLRNPANRDATDDAQALERLGHVTACITHAGLNPKVTRPEDVPLAEALLRLRTEKESRP